MTILALPEPDFAPLRGGRALRWGVAAPGGIANSFADSLHSFSDQRIVAVASRSQERAGQFAAAHGVPTAYGSYDQLMADPQVDIVYVAAPHSEHTVLALAAIAAGKHVLVEKPLATNVADARAIAVAARAAGVFAMEAMWTRYLPQTTVMARLLADGELGDVKQVTADFGFRAEFDPNSRMFNPALGGGALLDLGVYTVWFTHLALGSPVSISTVGSLASTGVDQHSVVTMSFGGDALGVASSSILSNTPTSASVSGTEARIEVASPFWAPSSLTVHQEGRDALHWKDESGMLFGQGLCYQAVAAAHYVAEGLTESPLHSLDDSLDVLAVLEEARRQLGAA